MQFLFISHKCLAQPFYDILLHFKSFNQVAFASDIYYEFKNIFSFQDKVKIDPPYLVSKQKITG